MKASETLLALSLLGLAGFIGAQSYAVQRTPTRSEAAGAIDIRQPLHPTESRTAGGKTNADPGLDADLGHDVDVVGVESREAAVPDDAGGRLAGVAGPAMPRLFADAGTTREMRRRIADGADGTYIDELLLARDSALARWPDRLTRPLRVWVDEATNVDGWTFDFVPAVRDAFDTWSAAGIPVRFDFVLDSASADVHVRFIERFANGISGKTIWSRDAGWWLVSGDIQLALAHPSGGTVSAPQMRAIALHEVGHLLGLDHASALDNIMSARVRMRDLSDADRATVRLLYSMPAGSIR
jgi:hypothetical protein